MGYRFVFPHGKKKALTFSYDDGTEHDRRLVALFNKYSLKATFHLNSGNFGTANECESYIDAEEVETLYAGHEISCHSVHHPFFSDLSGTQTLNELLEDKRALERLAHYPIRGMSYPYGEFSDDVAAIAKTAGMEYSRTVESTMHFNLPLDFLRWHPTCHHDDVFLKLEEFEQLPPYRRLALFYVWGQSYEFARQNKWEHIERFCQRVSKCEDVWFATNIEIKEYLDAARGLVHTADEACVYNPSATKVFLENSGKQFVISAGETLYFE